MKNWWGFWGIISPVVFFIFAIFILGITQNPTYATYFIVAILSGVIYLSMYFYNNIEKLKEELKAKTEAISYLQYEIRELNNIICDSYYDTKYLIEGIKEFEDKKLIKDKLRDRLDRLDSIQGKINNKFMI